MKGLLVLTGSENKVCAVVNPKSKELENSVMTAIGEELCGNCTELNMFDLSLVEYQPQEIEAHVTIDDEKEVHNFTLTHTAYYK